MHLLYIQVLVWLQVAQRSFVFRGMQFLFSFQWGLCVSVSFFLCTAMTKFKKKTKPQKNQQQKKRPFLSYSCCLSISVFITWVLSKITEREKSFSKECFHIPAIWDGSCHLSPLTTMFGTQSPSQNLVRWQILSPPFTTWSWKISSVLLAWFDLWSSLRAKISQDEWKWEWIKKKKCLCSQMDLLFALQFKLSWVSSVCCHLYAAACRHRANTCLLVSN